MTPTQPSDVWEQGSEFHWLRYGESAAGTAPWEAGSFWGSGRDALRALLAHGQQQRGWRRLWIPAYYCQEVVAALLSTGMQIAVYPDGPQSAQIVEPYSRLCPHDAVLRVNHFGLRHASSAEPLQRLGVEVLEDHTHDPWSTWALDSDADWCVASLRKTLPIPDGGVLWSPRGHTLPPIPEPTPERRIASLEKLAAMLLKSLYLDRHSIDKGTFRSLALSGESHIASGHVSGMPDWTRELIKTFPAHVWRRQRRRNCQTLVDALIGVDWLTTLKPDNDDHVSFSAIVLFDTSGRRDLIRRKLIEEKIYPAVLWSLDAPVVSGIDPKYIDFGARMLSFHCDMRYQEVDLLQTSSVIKRLGE